MLFSFGVFIRIQTLLEVVSELKLVTDTIPGTDFETSNAGGNSEDGRGRQHMVEVTFQLQQDDTRHIIRGTQMGGRQGAREVSRGAKVFC